MPGGGAPCPKQATAWTGYYYLGGDLMFDYSGSTEYSLIGNYVYVNGEKIAKFETNTYLTQVQYYLTDHLGSVVASVQPSGYMGVHNLYRAWGEKLHSERASGDNRFCYTGQLLDEDLSRELYYCGARYYDPMLKIFTSVDPKHSKYAGWGPYVYTFNNRVKFADADGKDATISIRGKQITVSSQIYIYGEGASQALVEQYQQNIMDRWNSGNWQYADPGTRDVYEVNFDVGVQLWNPDNPSLGPSFVHRRRPSNYVEVRQGKWKYDTHSQVYHGYMGTWKDDAGAAAHEFGHLLGFKDRYYYEGKELMFETGWGTNIMAEGWTGSVEQRNIDAIAGWALDRYNSSWTAKIYDFLGIESSFYYDFDASEYDW